MEYTPGSSKVNLITPKAFSNASTSSIAYKQKPVLPPILCEKDRILLKTVRKFIDEERKKIKCSANVYDFQRYAIYSDAFNQVISHVTVYKDILADIKREYEECIMAIKNGQKESLFLKNKIKTLSNLPTTIAGYARRKEDLEEKLETLQTDNARLEKELEALKKRDEQSDVVEEHHEIEEIPEEVEEKRPIPGLTVEQWTDVNILKQSVTKLDNAIQSVIKQQKTSYIPMSKKIETEELLNSRMLARDKMIQQGMELRKQNMKLKIAVDAVNTYRRKKLDPDFQEDLGHYLIKVLTSEQTLQRQLSWLSDGGQTSFEDDDPSKEKEAEMILEYIDKFNELFNDQEYEKAAVHAANSPRGVLRTMETLNRFRESSINCNISPTPLLLYSEALMHSSAAQEHVLDKEMSLLCIQCALNENRPDLVEHWTSKASITPCEEAAENLMRYCERNPQHKILCLVIAQKMFADTKSHMSACYTLFLLNHFGAMLDYAKNIARFTRNEYLNLIKMCPDATLVWSLCNPSNELTPDTDRTDHDMPLYQLYALPIRLDQAICALLESGEEGKEVASRFLDDLYSGSFFVDDYGESVRSDSTNSLHRIVYEETDGGLPDDDTSDWARVIAFCEDNLQLEVAMEIKAAQIVKRAVAKALVVIAQDEKQEFDYYT